MKKAIASAIAVLRQAQKDWVEMPKAGANKRATEAAKKARDKARKEVNKAIDILNEALKKFSGDGQDDTKP